MEEEKRIKAREAWRKWYERHKEENKERTYNYLKTEKGKKSHHKSINKYRQKNRERVNELARLRYQKKNKMDKDNKTWELCPYCSCEVELEWELKPQVCPSCGKWICPCSMCIICRADCDVEKECTKLNNNKGKI